jgi:dTDP-4-dehydrorhamnose reductase
MTASRPILLLGKIGQLGWELHRALGPLAELTAFDYPEIDFLHPATLRDLIDDLRPLVIVNAVAYTDVDGAESDPRSAELLNAEAPGVLAETARATGSLLIHYSTDYVFDGEKESPYVEADPPNPLNRYGDSKLKGEQAVQAVDHPYLIFRTSWVYSFRRPSFASKVREWARTKESLRIVTDQVGSPTWCRSLAETTALLLARLGEDPLTGLAGRSGLYHLAGRGSASRYQFAQAVLGLDPERNQHRVQTLEPAQASDFPSAAKRPARTALDCTAFEAAFNLRLPDWERALELALGAD